MPQTRKDESQPVLGDLGFHILVALGNGPAHGYAIGRDVEERSGGRLEPTTGALYQALRRLSDEGLIEPARAQSSDARRKYFRLTRSGRRAAALEAERLAGLVSTARARRLYPLRAGS